MDDSDKNTPFRHRIPTVEEEAERMAFVRERAIHDEASLIVDATRKGIEIGKTEERLETLTYLLNQKFGPLPDETTDQLQHATAGQLKQWTNNILFAASMDDVFVISPEN